MTVFQRVGGSSADTSRRQAAPQAAEAGSAPAHDQPPEASVPAAQETMISAPVSPGPGQPAAEDKPRLCAAIADSLLPGLDVPGRRAVAARLADLLDTRLRDTWSALLDAHEPLAGLLADPPAAFDAGVAVAELAASLEPGSVLSLLAADGVLQQHDVLAAALSGPDPVTREKVLDALLSTQTSSEFDQACRRVCVEQLVAALDRLPADEAERPDWRQRLEMQPRLCDRSPPPRHEDATEAALLAALRLGDNRGAIALLAAAALVPTESIDIAIGLRSRRGMVSLAWKAGFSMQAAVLLQSQLAEITCGSILTATADGGCPLSRGEMAWQIGFLARKLV
ncbi:hypothetical protein [Lichenicola sp.]|uniref:hypothetical protein n=1 Tax=Lichenicola sp. TaxID=2804529 RepID=UPI003B00F28B